MIDDVKQHGNSDTTTLQKTFPSICFQLLLKSLQTNYCKVRYARVHNRMCSFSLEACTISSKENQKAFEICCQSYFRAFKGLEIEEMYLFYFQYFMLCIIFIQDLVLRIIFLYEMHHQSCKQYNSYYHLNVKLVMHVYSGMDQI